MTNRLSSIPPEFDFSYFEPLEVKVRNGNVDRAIKIFRSLVQAERILANFKERQAYEKPSEKKRRKKAETMQRLFETKMKEAKIASGEYDREKLKKEIRKERKKLERANNKEPEQGNDE